MHCQHNQSIRNHGKIDIIIIKVKAITEIKKSLHCQRTYFQLFPFYLWKA